MTKTPKTDDSLLALNPDNKNNNNHAPTVILFQ